MAGYTSRDLLTDKTSIVIGASETDTVVTRNFPITHEDSKSMIVKVEVTTTTITNAVTANLQDSWDGGTTWADVKTVSITGDGAFEIEVNAIDGADTLMWPLGRITIDSGVDDAATITNVWVTRRL